MNEEQAKKVLEAMANFVIRVAEGNGTPEEVVALPGVVQELFKANYVSF